ncbi:MAG: SPASM domain-containing protein [Tissierellia bacterium]|nr:SPASM domain-containing protein [Tissierellia bacterium]
MKEISLIFFCGAGLSSIFINEKGGIYPCHLFEEDDKFYMGNIFDVDEVEINNSYIKSIGKLQKYSKDKIKNCNECIAKFWCSICIGADKEVKSCNDFKRCDEKILLTKKTLDKFSQLINSGELVNFQVK